MRSQYAIRWPLFGLLLTMSLGLSCRVRSDGEIRIAAVGPLTGTAAPRGQDLRQAVQMAVDETNAAGGLRGRRIAVDYYDDGDEPARARELAAKIAASPALAVLGQVASSAAIAAGPIYKQEGIPAITGAASEAAVTKGNEWFFRLLRDASGQGELMADLALYGYGTHEVAAIREKGTAGGEFASAFCNRARAQGIQVTADIEMVPADAKDPARLDAIAASLARLPKDDIVVLGVQYAETPAVLRKLRDKLGPFTSMGYSSLATDGLSELFAKIEKDRHLAPGFYTNGFTVAAPQLEDVAKFAQTVFAAKYRIRFHSDPTPEAVRWYEAAQLIFRAAAAKRIDGKDRTEDRRRIRDWLAALDGPASAVEGVSGPIYFDKDHNVQRGLSVGVFFQGHLISAPLQLTPVLDEAKVPGLDALRRAGRLIDTGAMTMVKTPVIYAGIDLNSIGKVDTRADTFAAVFFVWFRYRDDLNLTPDQIEFPTAVSGGQLGKEVARSTDGGFTTVTFPVKGVFQADFEFSRFPFDVQVLRIPIQIRDTTRYSLILAYGKTWYGPNAPVPSLDSKLWRIQDLLFYRDVAAYQTSLGAQTSGGVVPTLEVNRINAATIIRREVFGFAIKNFLPLLCILVAVFIGYALAPDVITPRISVGVTALLTTSVLYQKLAADLPAVTYLIGMDYVFFAVFAICVLYLLITVVIYETHKAKRYELTGLLTRSGIWLTVLGLAASVISVWVKYWSTPA